MVRLKMRTAISFARTTTLESFRWRTTAKGYGQNSWLQIKNSGGLCTENDSDELQRENYSIKLYSEKNSCLLQVENVRGERFSAGE